MRKIKKGDVVAVRTGNDKGKIGSVLKVMPNEDRLVVSGVNIRTHFNKPKQMTPGSIEKKESWIHVSNVSLVNQSLVDGNKDRITSLKDCIKVGFKMHEGKKVRFSKTSGEVIA